MKIKINTIICLLVMMVTSCGDNITSDELTIDADGTVPVNISLSMLSGINFDTGYEPMSRAEAPSVQIGRTYAVLISKKYENRWILDKFLKNNFADYIVKIYSDEVFHQFSTDLRPGEYKMTIITGYNALIFEKDLQPGLVVEDEDGNVHPACTYKIEEASYLNPGAETLQEEIFAGCVPFTVAKTEDLHSGSLINNVHVQLQRKVTKLRIFLKEEYNGNRFVGAKTDNDGNYQEGKFSQNAGISAQLDIVDNNVKFCNGINAWGDIYYDENNQLTSMKYGTFADENAVSSPVDNQNYFLTKTLGARQSSIFYFSDPNQAYQVTISKVHVTFANNQPYHAYAYPEHMTPETDESISLTMKHNTQHGLVFAPGNITPDNKVFNMILLTDEEDNIDYPGLFPLNSEYR